MSPKSWAGTTLLCITFLLLIYKLPALHSVPDTPLQSPPPAILYPDIEPLFLTKAFGTHTPFSIPTSTRIAIVPHHLIAARPIASLFAGLPKAKTLILLSPDHFSQGKTAFTVPSTNLCTSRSSSPDCLAGMLNERDLATLKKNVASISINNKPFQTEHGIYALLPFIKRTNPDAHIAPILVRVDATPSELTELATALEQLLEEDPETLLIASIDMSHYQTQEIAEFHDILTQNTIQRKDMEKIRFLEIDSPGSMYVALRLARDLGLAPLIQSHTNSLVISNAILARESTSHFVISFSAATSSIEPPPVTTEFWHQQPKVPTEEDRLYHGYLIDHPFTAPRLPYFFGVVRQGTVISVHPFPLDKNHLLETRDERRARIQRDEASLQRALPTLLHITNPHLVY